MRATAALTAALTLPVLPAAAACGSPVHPVHPAVGHPPQAAVAATLGTNPRPGSPAFCGTLARSSALRGLSAALTAGSENSAHGQADSTLRSAAADLRTIELSAPASLRPVFSSVASALTQLAGQNGWSTASLNAVSASLTQLGQEVEGPCGFPVG
jgi:hypothetical protein